MPIKCMAMADIDDAQGSLHVLSLVRILVWQALLLAWALVLMYCTVPCILDACRMQKPNCYNRWVCSCAVRGQGSLCALHAYLVPPSITTVRPQKQCPR